MEITRKPIGYTKDGEAVDCYRIEDGGAIAEILTLGGIIRSLIVPAPGGARDIALGFDDIAGYEAQKGYIGALIGRVGNRIGGASFAVNGKGYAVDANDGPNCLHGGFRGFDKQIWTAIEESDALALSLRSPDMECGFPGNLSVQVRYSLSGGALSIEYTAESDADTPISLTNHCYFNLGGHSAGCIDSHKIQIFSDAITLTDGMLIPTGETMAVAGTPFDLREPKPISAGLYSDHPQITQGKGYDQNFILSRMQRQDLATAAIVEYDGLTMACRTTQPGIQLYCGNNLAGEKGKGGAEYAQWSGFCLETQGWPDAINNPSFPDSILRKGEVYSHTTIYSFT